MLYHLLYPMADAITAFNVVRYITFRTARNFWNGRGLTWNPDERVQAYTHPLWMFVAVIAYGVSHEVRTSRTTRPPMRPGWRARASCEYAPPESLPISRVSILTSVSSAI